MDIASVLTAVGVLIPIIVAGFIAIWREMKKVHVIVNDHQTKQLNYIGLLIDTLAHNEIPVPPDASLPAKLIDRKPSPPIQTPSPIDSLHTES